MSFNFQNNTKMKSPLNEAFFVKIKDKILGKSYVLSLVFVGDQKSRDLNFKYRKAKYVPNVLSFPLEKKVGEIFINSNQAKKECAQFDMTYKKFLAYLFIHGCLHLKGLKHGKRMNNLEKKYLNSFIYNLH